MEKPPVLDFVFPPPPFHSMSPLLFIRQRAILVPCLALGVLAGMVAIPTPAPAHSPHDHIEAFDLAPSRTEPGVEVMLAVVRGNLWRSLDQGETWKRIARGIDARYELNALAVGATPDGTVWYLGTNGDGVYRSLDDGLSWSRMIEGLEGTEVRSLAARGDQVLLATSDHQVYVASATAPRWQKIRDHDTAVTIVAAGPAKQIVLGDDRGRFFESTDGGTDWVEILSEPDPAGASAFHFGESGARLAGFGTAGIRWLDGEEDSPRNDGLTDQRITDFLFREDGSVFVVTWNDGVFFAKDTASSWSPRAAGLTTDKQGDRRGLPQFTVLREAADGALFLAGYNGLFFSRDNGVTWRERLTLPQTLLIDFDLSPDFANDRELAAISYWKGAAMSRDAGASWFPINGKLSPSFWDQAKRLRQGSDDYAQVQRFHSITYSPNYAVDGTLFAGLRNWFLFTEDAGESWERIELTQFAGGEDVIPDRLRFSSDFATDGTLLFCSRFGEGATRAGAIFRSTDRGRSWAEVLRTPGKYMQSLALSPTFAEDGTGFTSSARGGNNSEVFRTTDGGLTWEIVTGELQFSLYGAELAISPDFATDQTVWAGTEQGLWLSRDAGNSWERQSTGVFPDNGFVDLIALSPATLPQRQVIVTVKGEGLFRSRDGGHTFEPFLAESTNANHQFNRLWSYSPGRLLKFAPIGAGKAELFGMTGEAIFRITPEGEVMPLPLRENIAPVGTVDLDHWRGAVISLVVAGIGAAGVIISLVIRVRRRRILAGKGDV